MKNLVPLSVCAAACLLAGCASNGHSVVAATATTIGLEIGTQAANGTPTSVLGYRRAELAYVPTNRRDGAGVDAGGGGGSGDGGDISRGGAKDVASVLMELRYGGTGEGGAIYQRLAVGEAASAAPAAALFSRGPEGVLDAGAAQAATAIGQRTLANVGVLMNCASAGGKVRPAPLKKIVDRALADPSTRAAVQPYASPLAAVAEADALRKLLLQSDALAAALTVHRSDADCAS